jgi:hypothetical protein
MGLRDPAGFENLKESRASRQTRQSLHSMLPGRA